MYNPNKKKMKMLVAVAAIIVATVIAAVGWKLGWLSKAKAKVSSLMKPKAVMPETTEAKPAESSVASGEATIEVS